jgi:transposase
MAGRRTKLSEEVADQIIGYVRAGNSLKVAAAAAGVGESTLHGWRTLPRAPYREFAERLEKAIAQAEIRNVAIVEQAATQSWQAAAWWLERRYPDRWAMRRDVTISGGDRPVRVEQKALNVNLDALPPDVLQALVMAIEGQVAIDGPEEE